VPRPPGREAVLLYPRPRALASRMAAGYPLVAFNASKRVFCLGLRFLAGEGHERRCRALRADPQAAR
jgi:hypothetical protein